MTVPVAAAAARAVGGRAAAAGAGRAGAGRAAGGPARPAPTKRARAAKVSQAERERRAAAEEFEAAAGAPTDPAPAEGQPAPAPATSSTRRASTRTAPDALSNQTGAPSWYRKTVDGDPVRAANAGGGFLLGLGVYALVLTYLRGGKPAVVRLLKAKFFNQVSAA